LNELPARQREVVYLRYFQDLGIEEIAQVLSVNYQSVLNALSRAMKNLKKLILSQKSLEIFLFILIPAALLFLL
jgi:DNA-directed RNA polymerase specialized sigma24 family protein